MNKTIETKQDRVQSFITTVLQAGQRCIEMTKDPFQSATAVRTFLRETNEAVDRFLFNMPASFKEATLKEVLKTVFVRIPGQVLMKLVALISDAIGTLCHALRNTAIAMQNILAKLVNKITKKETLKYWHFHSDPAKEETTSTVDDADEPEINTTEED